MHSLSSGCLHTGPAPDSLPCRSVSELNAAAGPNLFSYLTKDRSDVWLGGAGPEGVGGGEGVLTAGSPKRPHHSGQTPASIKHHSFAPTASHDLRWEGKRLMRYSVLTPDVWMQTLADRATGDRCMVGRWQTRLDVNREQFMSTLLLLEWSSRCLD